MIKAYITQSYCKMNDIEQSFVIPGLFPLSQQLSGSAKAIIGTLQMVTGLVLSIILAIPAIFNRDARELFGCSVTHIAHGFGNIIGGILETVPIIGSIVNGIRAWKGENANSAYLTTGQESKFMAYKKLIDISAGKIGLNNCIIIKI